MAVRPVAVLGIGHDLMRDDGIGVRVVRELARSFVLPPRVRLYEGSSGGFRFLAELDGVRDLVVVDAAKGGGPPGSLYRIRPGRPGIGGGDFRSSHEAGVPEILSLARSLKAEVRATLIGIEPGDLRSPGLQLSPAVSATVPACVDAVVRELRALGVRGIRKNHRADRT